MGIMRVARIVWVAGTALIVLSWCDVVTPRVGWAGWWIALVGAAVTWMPRGLFRSGPRAAAGRRSGPMARAERLLQIKRYAEAEAIYQDFLFNNPRDPDGLLGLSRCRHGQGDDEGAQRYLRQLLDVDPDSVRALVALGHLALERGDYRAADQAYGRALAINSNAVEAMYGQARVREQAGDVGEALRLLHRIAELAPETELAAQAYRRVAEIQAGLNRF